MAVIRWFRDLDPQVEEAVEQALHLLCGLFISCFFGSFMSMLIVYIREFWWQWPLERIGDTRKDMGYWILGSGIWEAWRWFH